MHVHPRTTSFSPTEAGGGPSPDDIDPRRVTELRDSLRYVEVIEDDWISDNFEWQEPWRGITKFFTKGQSSARAAPCAADELPTALQGPTRRPKMAATAKLGIYGLSTETVDIHDVPISCETTEVPSDASDVDDVEDESEGAVTTRLLTRSLSG